MRDSLAHTTPQTGDIVNDPGSFWHGAEAVACIEINPEATPKLKDSNLNIDDSAILVLEGDFMAFQPSDLGVEFDRVVMNPPFSKNQDIKHVKHALKFLRPGGKLVAIMSPNTTRKGFAEICAAGDCSIEEVPEGTFKESGTNIKTIILTLTKGGAR